MSEEPGKLQSWGCRVGHNWAASLSPTPVFCPGELHGLYSPWGCRVRHDWVTFTFVFIHNLNQLEKSVQSHWRQKAKNRNLQSLFIFPGIQTCYILGAGLFGHPGPDTCYEERRLRSGCSLQRGDCAWLGLGPVMTEALWSNIWLSHP